MRHSLGPSTWSARARARSWMRQRFVQSADEGAVGRGEDRQPECQLGLLVRVDTGLLGERERTRTPLERASQEQFERQGHQDFGGVGEEVGLELVQVEGTANSRLDKEVAHDPLAEQAKSRGRVPSSQKVPRRQVDAARLGQVSRGGRVQ